MHGGSHHTSSHAVPTPTSHLDHIYGHKPNQVLSSTSPDYHSSVHLDPTYQNQGGLGDIFTQYHHDGSVGDFNPYNLNNHGTLSPHSYNGNNPQFHHNHDNYFYQHEHGSGLSHNQQSESLLSDGQSHSSHDYNHNPSEDLHSSADYNYPDYLLSIGDLGHPLDDFGFGDHTLPTLSPVRWNHQKSPSMEQHSNDNLHGNSYTSLPVGTSPQAHNSEPTFYNDPFHGQVELDYDRLNKIGPLNYLSQASGGYQTFPRSSPRDQKRSLVGAKAYPSQIIPPKRSKSSSSRS